MIVVKFIQLTISFGYIVKHNASLLYNREETIPPLFLYYLTHVIKSILTHVDNFTLAHVAEMAYYIGMKKTKNMIAAEERWKKVSPERRAEMASAAAKARWSKIPKERRRRMALKLVRARKQNANTTKGRKKEKVS